jgi:cell division protein FtsI/penicillin-binding protein 2
VSINGRYGQDVITSFVGFAPVDHPQYTMFVLLRKPHKCSPVCEGAYIAVPVFKTMTQVIVDAWKIVP